MRRWQVLVMAGLALVALACNGAVADPGPSRSAGPIGSNGDFPSSMAALGDSLTIAYGSCLAPTPCPRNSWSTGDGTRVDSHYRRIARANPGMRGHAQNLAVPNARAADLAAQVPAAVRGGAQYVTILIGGNDACRGRIEDMTDPGTFRSQVDQALTALAAGLPKARVLVVSIPDVHRVWEVGHTNKLAVAAWSLGVCPALLANPQSFAEADQARRRAFDSRVNAFNAQLAGACAAYKGRCRFDGSAVRRIAFSLDMLSAQDFFHPNATGQGELASATYPGSFTW